MSRTIRVEKHVDTYVDVEVEISNDEILEIIKEDDDYEEIIEELGYIKKEDLGMEQGTILELMKIELIRDLMVNATLEQLEQFRKTL